MRFMPCGHVTNDEIKVGVGREERLRWEAVDTSVAPDVMTNVWFVSNHGYHSFHLSAVITLPGNVECMNAPQSYHDGCAPP